MALTVLMRLGVAQNECDAAPVEVTLPLPLSEGLPLAVPDNVPVTLKEGEIVFDTVLVRSVLPVYAPLAVGGKTEPDPHSVLL